ncbi:putative trna (uracil-5-)-methyltransferase [Phialemonium atrogriseum]|uniref:tRNA (uracil(54)-C(5))-methyltransferase n=1 Tax=Phialemonium atrogriseum TaxID=1093897 RepID=A0AAJ0CDK7_9PEZI|nr:putative trna (uracil-5-)-methyltransferase [Phialemonium atrogriseum]KAK1772371.1 putative trna (uracil-5-)-methyltransferase [Phialemonium atrogriseum]
MNGKRMAHDGGGDKPKKFKKRKQKPVQEGSAEEVLLTDIQSLLASQKISDGEQEESTEQNEAQPLPEPGSEIDVEVIELSSTGDGLAKQKGSDRIYAVPFSVPGDTVRVKVYRHLDEQGYTVADFISVTKASPLRDNSRIQCQYFGRCSGCQFQMLEYPEQLKLKKRIVEKAFKNFSQLPPELVPAIQETIGSPLQYGYRTKLTPHFDGPPGMRRRGPRKALDHMPPIGFTPKGSTKVLDIEDCPIGTDAVRKGMKMERERMAVEYGKYERGATLLLRENTQRVPKSSSQGNSTTTSTAPDDIPSDSVKVETDSYTDYKTCITDNNATTTEYIDDFVFTNPAGAFFQNNSSILPPFTDYIRQHILPPPPSTTATPPKPIKYLIDAYSGSGLFTITLSSLFTGGSTGIDIADKSIAFARRNATLNGLDEAQCRFIAADAPELFRSVSAYDPDETVVVLDPPRKGCDAGFLRQLLSFAPRRVVYVSCNVHTQARDVGVLVRGEVGGAEEGKNGSGLGEEGEGEGEGKKQKGARYEIESLRGFDFFPQTGHVEGVAILNRVDG